MRSPARLPLILVLLWLIGCTGETRQRRLFEILSPGQTGVTFANTITTSDSLNVLTDPYVYNGAGVGIGDIDNDGLPDLFLAGNMVSSRLYLNKGHMRFEDITERAGVKTSRWATGVAMVDINNDGYLDIYVSVSGPPSSRGKDRANLLFINNGNRTFTESAAKYGLADTGFTTQAAFLDYNGDGCIDVFLLENSPQDFTRSEVMRAPTTGGGGIGSYNQLYRNNCNGTFTNVSREAGILNDPGYGLGVAVADVNGDGRPDIYVSNDVAPNDVLYINNGDGTFTNEAGRWLKHTSYAGMGVDIADFNDDGWPDILQVDMMPRALARRKRMSGFLTYASQMETRSRGFRVDYSVNSLQLSNGLTDKGDVVFSDIAHLAGVAYSDWSWSALFADFDNDGRKDIFIGNGYPKAVTDLDYQNSMIASRRAGSPDAVRRAGQEILKRLPGYDASNMVFRNSGDLTFTDETTAWGIERPSFSYGAAYADLDNDGRLDLVVNNIDAPAFIYHNVEPADSAHRYLQVRLAGEAPNREGIGTSLVITAGGRKQYAYMNPYRGYMSSVDSRIYFGLGNANRVDSLEVVWPDRRRQVLTNVPANQVLLVKQSDASGTERRTPPAPATRPFEVLHPRGLEYKQQLSTFVDFSEQPLLPYMISKQGPPIAVADVNGDGLEDVFVGGSGGVPGKLFLQQRDGSFIEQTQGEPWAADRAYEDWGAVFFDANGDGRPDLYVASCSAALVPGSPLLQDRLYINRGGGRFVRDTAALPAMPTCTASVAVGDFNGDGKPDLFVGGRLTPEKYPYPTRSYLLRNDGGHFTDVTEAMAPSLVQRGGMITAAAWVDLDGDGKLDLVTAGEWMPIQFYHNDGTRLRDVTSSMHLPPLRGWWYSLAVADFDHDGRPDLVAGNLGLNFTYTASSRSPFGVYAGNFTGGRTTDVVLTKVENGTEYPFAGLVPLGQAIYPIGIKFPTYASFAEAPIQQVFSADELKQALHYQADTFASVVLHNDGRGRFSVSALPNLAQISPLRGIVATDVDGDGNLDLVIGGNLYDTEPNTPRADAGNGLWLRGDGKGHFTPVSPRVSGFLAPLDVSGLAMVRGAAGERLVLVANTGDSLQVYRIRNH